MMNMDRKERLRFLNKLIVSGGALILFLGGLYFLFYKLGLTNVSQDELQEFIKSTGVIAPLIYILITFLQVTFIPIPSTVTILVGSYLFGPFGAFFLSYIGLMIGSLVAYGLGKLLGRPFINWLSGSKEETEKWMSKLNGKENILLFFMFLFPIFPDDVLCSIAGILPITFRGFLWMQIITRATSVGCTLLFMTGQIIPFNGWGIPVIGVGILICFIAFIYCFKNADKINSICEKLHNNIFKRKKNREASSEEDI